MPLVLKDRVKETSTTTGTGTLTLAGAATGFQSFAVIGNGNTTYYAIYDRTSQDWEVGVGTYTSSGTTLTRDSVLESSNSGSLVNFGAGTKDVFCTYPAEKAVTLDDVQTLTNKTLTSPTISGGSASLDSASIAGNNISATNSLGFRNRIINGDMRIDQRNNGAAVTNANGYITDRFIVSYVGSAVGRMTAQQSTLAPPGFNNSLALTVTTTMASPGSNDGNYLQQTVEGFNAADLGWGTANAQTVTLSFWVRSSVTGSFALTLFNADVLRVYGALYSISAANTWEQKTIVVPGDTSGTWNTTNGAGVRVTWGFAGGATRTASTGWNAGGGVFLTSVTSATNLMATSGATFYITGVQLEAGSVATPFERRPYGNELQLCQRYFQALDTFIPINTAGYFAQVCYTRKRATPTVSGGGTNFDTGTVVTPDLVFGMNSVGSFQTLQISAEL